MRMAKLMLAGMTMCAAAIAQTASVPAAPASRSESILAQRLAEPPGQVVTGEPYTATSVTRTDQTLADGTHIHHELVEKIARDMEGREWIENIVSPAKGDVPELRMIIVTDPMAGTRTTWSEGGEPRYARKEAMVVKMAPLKVNATPAPRTIVHKPIGITTHEDLGQQSIEGLMATGMSWTTVIPAGALGNDQPITTTHETWTSAEPKLVLRSMSSDPRTGTMTMELKDLSREDPLITVFQPPADYTIRDITPPAMP